MHSGAERSAFRDWMRNGGYAPAVQTKGWFGSSATLALDQKRRTTHYVWRTRRDDKVRPSHAANEGRIFAWDAPPPTGHPGKDYGCRCTAEPFDVQSQEHISINMDDVSDAGGTWTSRDFVRHYYRGRGQAVTVRQTGHLEKIVDKYSSERSNSLANLIAREARKHPDGSFTENFYNTYDMTALVFSIGDTTIGGRFVGHSSQVGDALLVAGDLEFYLRDEFSDPLDLGIEALDLSETIYENLHRPLDDYLRGRASGPQRLGVHTGEPYAIEDAWTGRFKGKIYLDVNRSALK